MTLYKRATCASKLVSSSSVYVCSNCDYTEMAGNTLAAKICPKCGAKLTIISANTQPDMTINGSADVRQIDLDEEKKDNE